MAPDQQARASAPVIQELHGRIIGGDGYSISIRQTAVALNISPQVVDLIYSRQTELKAFVHSRVNRKRNL